jgi:glycosyltransferase involved in cell wall biosynthesis
LTLIDIHAIKFGAIEEYALALSTLLFQRGSVGAVGFTENTPEWLQKQFTVQSIPILTLPAPNRPWAFIYSLRKILRLNRINILHATFFSTYDPRLILSTIGSRCRLIHSDQCSRKGHPKSSLFSPLRFIRNKVLQQFIHTVIADAEFIKSCQINDMNMPRDKLKVIYNGVNTTRFAPSHNAQSEYILQEFDLPDDSKIIVCIAQLIPEKGVVYLIEAVAQLMHQYPRLYVFLVGEGPQRDELQLKVQQLGLQNHIHFTGLRIDTESFLAAADIFVLLSVWEEAFAFSLLEAMAAGCPVVATRIGAIPESVIHQETGLLVPPRDPEAAAQAIQYLLDHDQEREQMGLSARKRVEDHFSLERWVSETIQLYEEILQN